MIHPGNCTCPEHTEPASRINSVYPKSKSTNYHSWQKINKALRRVLHPKTTPDVIDAIVEDLFEELNKYGRH